MLTQQLLNAFALRLRSEDGQGMVEYGLIIALIAVVVIGVLTALGGQVNKMFCSVWTALGGTGSCP
jgi:pilus assembly protein Flp/PilA